MQHRGPDDDGQWWSDDGRVGFGHRRLSIVDLSAAGHQPMHMPDAGLSIMFNGEIYNFQELRRTLEQLGYAFRSHSDTEVLLAAYAEWGTDCLARLNGMFAFALFDARNNLVFLARDRAGEKPLFYRHDGDTLYFASELKALMANADLPRTINRLALDCYLAMGYVPGELCILDGFNKLPPAHALVFDLSSGLLQQWRYWSVPPLDSDPLQDESRLVSELEALLEDAVGRQLVADVPVGVLLSGGVDSSLVTAMAVRRSSNVRTFSIGFPGHGSTDETEHARLIAKHFGTVHTELAAEPGTADLLPLLARQYDEPLIDSSMIPTWLVSNLVREHCTVALGGDGGDELFGGYGHYNRLLWMDERVGGIPRTVRRVGSGTVSALMPVGFVGRNWVQALGADFENGLPLVASYFDAPARAKLLGASTLPPRGAERVFAERVMPGADIVQRATRTDFTNYMPEDILVKVDRASMSNSLEVRAPFLDYRIIEFAFRRVPSHLKTTSTSRKIILKQLCEKVLPPEFDRQRKQGFEIPLISWLKAGPFRELFWSVLTDESMLFDRKEVRALLDRQDKWARNGERLFGLVQFELWRRHYGVSL